MTTTQNNPKTLEQKLAALAALGGTKPSATSSSGGSDSKTPPSTLWVNVGYEDPEEGRINLPYNLPIEHMRHRDTSGKNVDWVVQSALSNALLDQLRELALTLEPGQRLVLPVNFTVELYRAEDKNVAASSDDVQARVEAAKARLVFGN